MLAILISQDVLSDTELLSSFNRLSFVNPPPPHHHRRKTRSIELKEFYQTQSAEPLGDGATRKELASCPPQRGPVTPPARNGNKYQKLPSLTEIGE
jgi:hypothetical protein